MITVIISNVSGNGAKFIGTNLAVSLINKKKEKKVLLVDFDLNSPTLGYGFYEHNEKTNNFNIIMHQLYQRDIDKNNISKNIIQTKFGLDLLEGFKLTEIDITEDISQDMYVKFFNALKEMYDEVIIVSNINIYSQLSIMTMKNADKIVLVGRNNRTNIEVISRTHEVLNTYTNAKRYLINNMHERKDIQLKNLPLLKDYMFLGNITYSRTKTDNQDLFKGKYSKLNFNNRIINKAVDLLFDDGGKHE